MRASWRPRALRSLGRDNQAGGVWELEPFALLLAIRDKKQLYALQDPVLDCLIRSDAELNLDLIQTLETYLDCGRNGKLAAGKLFYPPEHAEDAAGPHRSPHRTGPLQSGSLLPPPVRPLCTPLHGARLRENCARCTAGL